MVFASIPLVYPLATKFLEDEKAEGESYLEEIKIYLSLFAGEAVGFTMIGLSRPDMLTLQAQVAGISGMATQPVSFMSIFMNNMMVFFGILAVSAVIGSAGAFILVWNASVLGKFFASLLSRLDGIEVLTGSSQAATPIAYIPHATLEMTGFILAGISGSMISAAVYREHFDWETWDHLVKLVLIGFACILAGALLETA
ncbi:stage II sporulation protein M [Candidatus Nanohalobium constans]|uniref:stage II sporulation protein M n=1 Tax=Candidatus Nanohalobium constans TaxID=2565781 RepID=UPI001C3D83B6